MLSVLNIMRITYMSIYDMFLVHVDNQKRERYLVTLSIVDTIRRKTSFSMIPACQDICRV